MLFRIEVHPVDIARRGDRARIEEMAAELLADFFVGRSQAHAFFLASLELRSDWTAGSPQWRGSHDQDRWHRHSWLDRRVANGGDQRSNALGGVPGIVLMHRLEIVRPEHEHDQR